ncbi:MAG: hypothetical protein U1E05_21620 [Patescibacteria group bacterium]|nr:hypothetical protein [Patescibacteria group bacterium]
MSPFVACRFRVEAAAVAMAWTMMAATVGCGARDVAHVKGSVSYQQQPLGHGRVVFHPEAGRPAFGEIGPDGTFTLTTRDPRDGALVGNHRVTVHCDQASDPTDAFSDRDSLVPARYQKPETSGLTAQVEPGTNTFHFELSN